MTEPPWRRPKYKGYDKNQGMPYRPCPGGCRNPNNGAPRFLYEDKITDEPFVTIVVRIMEARLLKARPEGAKAKARAKATSKKLPMLLLMLMPQPQ